MVTTVTRDGPPPGGGLVSNIHFSPTRIQLPVFGGANKEYEAWKAAFKLCVDETSASDLEKLLYLRKYLKGEALNLIECLGFSAAAYKESLCKLEARYGGPDRIYASIHEEIRDFRPLNNRNVLELDRLLYLLESTIVRLKDLKREEELGPRTLYQNIIWKMGRGLILDWHRYCEDHEKSKGIVQLKLWLEREIRLQLGAARASFQEVETNSSNRPRTYYTRDRKVDVLTELKGRNELKRNESSNNVRNGKPGSRDEYQSSSFQYQRVQSYFANRSHLDTQLENFREMDELPEVSQPIMSPDEQKIFDDANINIRYIDERCEIPTLSRDERDNIPSTQELAESRLVSLNKKQMNEDIGLNIESFKNDIANYKNKLSSKNEALIIMKRELDKCQLERNQFKLMAEQAQQKYQDLRQSSLSGANKVEMINEKQAKLTTQQLIPLLHESREANKVLQFELEENKRKLFEYQGEIKLLHEKLIQNNLGILKDSGNSIRKIPQRERAEIIARIVEIRDKDEQLRRDLEQCLDGTKRICNLENKRTRTWSIKRKQRLPPNWKFRKKRLKKSVTSKQMLNNSDIEIEWLFAYVGTKGGECSRSKLKIKFGIGI